MIKYDYFRTAVWYWDFGGFRLMPRDGHLRTLAETEATMRECADAVRQSATLAERWEHAGKAMRKFERHARSQRNRGTRYSPEYRIEQDALRARKFGIESAVKWRLGCAPFEDWPSDLPETDREDRTLYVLECQRVGVSYRSGVVNIVSGGDYVTVCGQCINAEHIAADIELVVVEREEEPHGICEECHRAFGEYLDDDDDNEEETA